MATGLNQTELNDEEIRMIIDVMKYAMNNCPIESASDEVDITADKVANLISKLEKMLQGK